MKNNVRTYIANSSYLIQEGLKNVLSEASDIDVVGCGANRVELFEQLPSTNPSVVFIDYSCDQLSLADVERLMKEFPDIRVIGITAEINPSRVKRLMSAGLSGHLMNDCDKDEIMDSVRSCHSNERFFCGKVLNAVNELQGEDSELTCEPVILSERELEVLDLIAAGLTTKQIAEQLHLSFHTVMTHRKNMMTKLGLNNTAGLIIYAIRENLIQPNKFLFSSS